MTKALTAAVSALLLGWASSAAAERPGDSVARSGLVLGFALGGGAITCSGCASKAAATGDFHIGAMVSPRLALMLEAAGTTSGETDKNFGKVTTTNALATVAAQYWVARTFWVKGGIGIGSTRVGRDAGEMVSARGLGLLGAAGYELVQRRQFALDLQGRFGSSGHQGGRLDQLTLALGLNWY